MDVERHGRRNIAVPLIGLLILFAFVVLGSLDHHEARDDARHYCQMVADGVWPDYRGTAANCGERHEQ